MCVENHFYCGDCYQCKHGNVVIVLYHLLVHVMCVRSASHLSEVKPIWSWKRNNSWRLKNLVVLLLSVTWEGAIVLYLLYTVIIRSTANV